MTRRFRAPATGVLDQVVNAGANAATGLLAYPLLNDKASTGAVVLALSWAYFAIGVTRAVVGEPLLAHVARTEGEERAGHVRDAAATAVLLGLLASAVCLLGWAIGPHYLTDLVWLAPFLPFALLHDCGRYVALSARRPQDALVLDLVWVTVQAGALVTVLVTHSLSGGLLLVCWGLGGVAGATAFLLRGRVNPAAGSLRGWIAETRHLSAWFTGTALLGQAQVQLVYLLVIDLLNASALAILRLAQYGLLMPVQNLQIALIGLLVPRASRMAHAGDVAGIRRQTRRVLAGTAAAAVVPLALSPLAGPLLRWLLPEYADVATIAPAVAVQAAIYLLQVPFTAAMRGMQRARTLFLQSCVFTATSLTGLVTGAIVHGLVGAAWGLTAGAAVGFTLMVVLYRRTLARFAADPSGAATDAGAADTASVG